MSTKGQTETTSIIDSCQITTATVSKTSEIVTPITATSESVLTQKTYATTLAATPIRKTFEEQQPFIFSIIGFALAYIITLIIAQIIKSKLAHH